MGQILSFYVVFWDMQTLSKSTEESKTTPQRLKTAISRSANETSHLQHVIWKDVYQNVPHGKIQLIREKIVAEVPYFIAF